MKKIYLVALILVFNSSVFAQNNYYFGNKKYNAAIPSPETFLGYEIGSHHTRYDKLVEYMYLLSKTSNRVKVEKIGETSEHREQIIVHFAKPDNLAQIEKIRKEHLDLTQGKIKSAEIANLPVVVWLGYNVHGNEASGGEASILTAYYLAASEEPETLKWFENAVFLMEPVINPDGRDRFNNWVNMHKGDPLITDPNDREHNEVWPSGRVNHYWFDLNRDWYLAVHKESRNRLSFYHKWLPNVVTDFHEMGTNSTHFFEPSKSNAENPLVPQSNYKTLNLKFAKYFEKAMNEIGSLYYTKESFDNFYPGYGSSYPDMQGGLGLLFEQGSSRGHAQDSQNGVLTFRFAVRNQFVNALATIKASVDEKNVLLQHQVDFFKDVVNQSQKNPIKGYVIGDNYDEGRNKFFWDFLAQHTIQAYHLNSDFNQEGNTFKKGKAVYIPLDQPQSLLVKSIFDRPKKFADSLFYDSSAWNLALAFGLNHTEVKTLFTPGKVLTNLDLQSLPNSFEKSDFGYLLDWREYNAANALVNFHSKEIRIKVITKAFQLNGVKYPQGTILIPVQNQIQNTNLLYESLKSIGLNSKVSFQPIATAFSEAGIDLGSNFVKTIEKPKPLMIIGTGTSQYEAGEVWHLLDTKLNMPITKVEMAQFGRINLNKYTHLVLVSGSYDILGKSGVAKIKDWVSNGGILICQKTATEWVIKNGVCPGKLRELKIDSSRSQPRINFDEFSNSVGAKSTGGAIFETELDLTNPIAFGFNQKKLAIYRNNNTMMESSTNPSNTPSVYTSSSWLTGYVHPEVLQKINASAAINIESVGNGKVILFADNPNFRGTWFSTNKLFFNALFFSNILAEPRLGNEE